MCFHHQKYNKTRFSFFKSLLHESPSTGRPVHRHWWSHMIEASQTDESASLVKLQWLESFLISGKQEIQINVSRRTCWDTELKLAVLLCHSSYTPLSLRIWVNNNSTNTYWTYAENINGEVSLKEAEHCRAWCEAKINILRTESGCSAIVRLIWQEQVPLWKTKEENMETMKQQQNMHHEYCV